MFTPSRPALFAVDRVPQPLVLTDNSVTVSFSGDMGAAGVPMMRLHLRSLACDDGPQEIVADLSGVTWLDKDGIEPLIEAHRLQMSRGAALRMGEISIAAARFLKSEPRLAQVLGRPTGLSAGSVPRPFPDDAEIGPDLWVPRPDELEVRALREEITQLREALSNRDAVSQSRNPASEQDH